MISKIFISYKDENDSIINGYFKLVEKNNNFIKIETKNNIITLPYHRILKMKEMKGGNKI